MPGRGVATSKKFEYGDPEYDTIYDEWVAQNYPSQFDITDTEDLGSGQEGGAIFQVLDTTATYPDFYMRWSRGPTRFNENNASEHPSERGWLLMNEDYWKWKLKQLHDGRYKVEMEDAPNDLA